MIAPEAGLSVSRQCALLGIARSAARRQPGRQRMQAPRKSDVCCWPSRALQAIGQEGDEDVGLNTCLELVKDRPDRQVALEVLERLLRRAGSG
jgi:hypothetical protein